MRCMACGEEMRVVVIEPHDTITVPGFQYHTFECPACRDTERRLVFSRNTGQPAAQAMPEEAVPPVAPTAQVEDDRTVPSVLLRALARMRGRQAGSSH